MQLIQSRRDFLTTLSTAGAASVLSTRAPLADEGPPETTTVRLTGSQHLHGAMDVAEDLLRAEGFTDIRYLRDARPSRQRCAWRDRVRQVLCAGMVVSHLDDGSRSCLGGRALGVLRAIRPRAHPDDQRPEGQKDRDTDLSTSRAPKGLDHGGACRARTSSGIDWVTSRRQSHETACRRQDRCFPWVSSRATGVARAQDRARDPRHHAGPALVAVLLLHDRRQQGVRPGTRSRPSAVCVPSSRRPTSAPRARAGGPYLVERGITPHYEYALQTLREIPYSRWREYVPEDTIRFYALRLHEVGMIKSSPQQIIAGDRLALPRRAQSASGRPEARPRAGCVMVGARAQASWPSVMGSAPGWPSRFTVRVTSSPGLRASSAAKKSSVELQRLVVDRGDHVAQMDIAGEVRRVGRSPASAARTVRVHLHHEHASEPQPLGNWSGASDTPRLGRTIVP